MALVEVRNVSKIYRLGGEEIRALDNVSLDIDAGQFMSIIGPSGSGKSTLMHILGCLDSPSEGTIQLDGSMIQGASARQLARIRNQKIGFVFQFFNLIPSLTVLENVTLPAELMGLSSKEARLKAAPLLEEVVDLLALGLSDALVEHLLGRLRGDASQLLGRLGERDFDHVARLQARIDLRR